MYSKGDKVSVLDEDINGVVLEINGSEISIETDDGFTMNFSSKELIKINETSDLNSKLESFNLSKILSEKEEPRARSFVKEKKNKGTIPPPEFDLHIEKLVPNYKSMSNYDILTLQSDTAKRHLEFAIRNRIPKIIFIHGVGEGILKSELDFLLGRYENISFQDGNYQKYGIGATEVTIKQTAK